MSAHNARSPPARAGLPKPPPARQSAAGRPRLCPPPARASLPRTDEAAYQRAVANLGGIGNENTQFKVNYNHRAGGSVWGPDKTEVTDTFVCQDNGRKTVTLSA